MKADDKLDKERRVVAIQYISGFLYQAGDPSMLLICWIHSKVQLELLDNYGPNLKPPSSREVRVTCLKKEVSPTHDMLMNHGIRG